MIKRYSSPCVRFTVNIKKDGKSFPLTFDCWDPNDKRRYILVSDPVIQKQLESLEDFNVYYRLDGVIEEEKTVIEESKDSELPKKASLETVVKKDLMEAKRWLNQCGVSYSKMRSKDTVIVLARELGYELSLESDKNK